MKMGAIIKEKRLAKGLTQEQVAARLGVSAPAVNKWENAGSYPDITLLPPLARLLGVDLNTLLSFKDDLTDEEMGRILTDINNEAAQNGPEHAYRLAMEAVREYPACDKLLLNIALTIEGWGMLRPASKEEAAAFNAAHDAEIEGLYTRAADSENAAVAQQAVAMLQSRLRARGEYAAAEALLQKLPDEGPVDKAQIKASLYVQQGRLEEAALLAERRLLHQITSVQSLLFTLLDIACKEGRTQDATALADASQEMTATFDLWDYNAHVAHLQLALHTQDASAFLAAAEALLAALLHPWNPTASPLYRHLPVSAGSHTPGAALLPKLLAELQDPSNPEFDFVRDAPGFAVLVARFSRFSA